MNGTESNFRAVARAEIDIPRIAELDELSLDISLDERPTSIDALVISQRQWTIVQVELAIRARSVSTGTKLETGQWLRPRPRA